MDSLHPRLQEGALTQGVIEQLGFHLERKPVMYQRPKSSSVTSPSANCTPLPQLKVYDWKLRVYVQIGPSDSYPKL